IAFSSILLSVSCALPRFPTRLPSELPIAAAEESLRRWLEQAGAGAVRENPHGRPVGTADAKPLGQAEMSGAPGRAPTAPVKGTAFAKAAQVRELAEQGLDATAIARRLGIGRGEVELILRLPKPDRG